MSRFIESIKYRNHYYNLEFHQERLTNTMANFYPGKPVINLSEVLKQPAGLIQDQLYKCRVVYNEKVTEITYEPYVPRNITQYYLLVCPDDFDYSYKFADRTVFNKALEKLSKKEDVIYVKKGLITDTTYANIVFSDGHKLFTPAKPLLKGTKRAFYLRERSILEEEIKVSDLTKFKNFVTINAMLDLDSTPAISCHKLLLSHNYIRI